MGKPAVLPKAVEGFVEELVLRWADVNGNPEENVHSLGIALCGIVEKWERGDGGE
jgi:hypothetical protein